MLDVRLAVPETAPRGVVVPLTLHVVHPGPDMLELWLRGRAPTLDVEVARPDGAVVWRRLDGVAVPAVVQLRVMGPGEKFLLHASWDQRDRDGRPVPAGEYVVRGFLLTDAPEAVASAPVALRVVDAG